MAAEKLQLTPGEAVEVVSVDDDGLVVEATYAPGGAVHRMSNDGAEPARVRWTTSPAGRTLDWFRAAEATQRRVGGSKLRRAAAFPPLLYKYRDTFRLARG